MFWWIEIQIYVWCFFFGCKSIKWVLLWNESDCQPLTNQNHSVLSIALCICSAAVCLDSPAGFGTIETPSIYWQHLNTTVDSGRSMIGRRVAYGGRKSPRDPRSLGRLPRRLGREDCFSITRSTSFFSTPTQFITQLLDYTWDTA